LINLVPHLIGKNCSEMKLYERSIRLIFWIDQFT